MLKLLIWYMFVEFLEYNLIVVKKMLGSVSLENNKDNKSLYLANFKLNTMCGWMQLFMAIRYPLNVTRGILKTSQF